MPNQPGSKDIGLKIMFVIMLVLAAGSAVFYFTGRPSKDESLPDAIVAENTNVLDEVSPEQQLSQEPLLSQESSESEIPSVPGTPVSPFASLLPNGADIMTAANRADVTGDWTGEFHFTVMEGFEKIDGAPDNIEDIVRDALQNPSPFTMTLEEDGSWEFNIEFMGGMRLNDRDFRVEDATNQADLNAHLYQGPADGVLYIHPAVVQDTESSDNGSMSLDAVAAQDAQGKLVIGTLSIELNAGGTQVTMEGNFTVRPEE